MFEHALVRTPGNNFQQGLRREDLGVPDLPRTLRQHRQYCDALRACGLQVRELPADPAFPDGTFVEDTAVLLPTAGILTRPGAPSRAGETDAISAALRDHYPTLARIEAPGTLDGGDICEAGRHVFIGLSARTNAEGAAQLSRWLAAQGWTASTVDIRTVGGILHLKSGLAWLGERRLLVIEALASHPAFEGFEAVRVVPEEAYAANAVRVNDKLLIASGYTRLQATLEVLGYDCLALDMSEFAKMDGGLSCLSLRY